MNIKINNLNISYLEKGKGKNIILLHGWGRNKNDFDSFMTVLSKRYKVYSIDLPGFGKSDEPKSIYSTSDYAKIVKRFIEKLKIENPTLIGHSFGGKIIIDLMTHNDNNIEKSILIDSAGIKKKKKFIQKFKTYKYKLYKNIIKKIYSKERAEYLIDDLKRSCGSPDYINSSGIMRDTLVKIVNEDYKDKLHNINTPTLLIWGSLDNDTPLSDGKIMNKEIKNSGLVTIKNANHFPFFTNLTEILIIIDNFLQN